jgi:hypothetical protein
MFRHADDKVYSMNETHPKNFLNKSDELSKKERKRKKKEMYDD